MVRNTEQQGYEIEQNPFESVVVDVTSRCNLDCALCFQGQRTPQDLDVEVFRDFCARLPAPVTLKLSGGEPTLHPDLPALIRAAVGCKHRVYLLSNGMRYREPEFMASLQALSRAGIRFALGMSMDGGTDHAEAYRRINGGDLLAAKREAFAALAAARIGRVCLSAIIVRGLNEEVVGQLLALAREHADVVRYIHLRNAASAGSRYASTPYSMEELRDVVRPNFTREQFAPRCLAEPHCAQGSGADCCYRFRPTPRLQVSLIEFLSERSLRCPKRGRLSLGATRLQPCFQSIVDDAPPVRIEAEARRI